MGLMNALLRINNVRQGSVLLLLHCSYEEAHERDSQSVYSGVALRDESQRP